MRRVAALLVIMSAAGCRGDDNGNETARRTDDGRLATAYATGSDRLSRDELEAGRLNMDWREFVERDTTAAGDTTRPGVDESWDDITVESVNSGPVALPVFGDVAGPSVLRVQILLGRAVFSPGIVDGRWGRNTEKAVYWLQRREGLNPTGHVDQATWERLQRLANQPRELVRSKRLTADDVAGPFVTLPDEYYDRRDMECQCYESLAEKLAELHHTTDDLLRQLNPGVDLNSVQTGTELYVPALDRADPAPAQGMASASGSDTTRSAAGRSQNAGGGTTARQADAGQADAGRADAGQATPGQAAGQAGAGSRIAKIVISDGGRYLHALDASGRIVYHFPATLGSDYSPSPTGDYSITGIAHDPSWHYQPDLLEGVDDDEPDAVLPPGPNNAVGVVWMQLSRPHYGIHGTSAPETIGYATSNGCVRLTNWDAEFLARRVEAGVPVEFRDVR